MNKARELLALPDANLATKVEIVRIQEGHTIYVGEVADQSDNLEVFGEYATGGGLQIYITDRSHIDILTSGSNQ